LGTQTENQANSLLDSRIHELEKELSEERNGEEALILQDRIAFFEKHHEGLYLQAFDDKLKVSPAMVDVLGLTKEEQQAIEQHLAQIKNEVDKYEDANMTVVKQSADSVTYEIPANPGGRALQAELNSLISSDIGSDRAELITADLDKFPFTTLSSFDENKRQVAIKWTNQNGSPLYMVYDSSFEPDGKTHISVTNAGNSLPPKYAKLLQPEPGQ
jgi:hypothetical protein